MLIAFEGPDEVGKSTTAKSLSHDGNPVYNITRQEYVGGWDRAEAEILKPEGLVQTFDRVDWFTHMIYRLAMPERDWNDDRVRTVFAMPDTHLIVSLHRPEQAEHIATTDEPYAKGDLEEVNDLYAIGLQMLVAANRRQQYALFKTISLLVVNNDQSGALHSFTRDIWWVDSPAREPGDQGLISQTIRDDAHLLDIIREADHEIA